MKNISILKTIRVLVAIAFMLQLSSTFFKKQIGEKWDIVFMSSVSILFLLILILAFGFGKKLEKEKIEREERKGEARKKISSHSVYPSLEGCESVTQRSDCRGGWLNRNKKAEVCDATEVQ